MTKRRRKQSSPKQKPKCNKHIETLIKSIERKHLSLTTAFLLSVALISTLTLSKALLTGNALQLGSGTGSAREIEGLNLQGSSASNDNAAASEFEKLETVREREPTSDDAGSGNVFNLGTEEELRDKGLGAFAKSRPDDNPSKAMEIVSATVEGKLKSEMVTNKSRAVMSCETGAMIVKMNFTEPFKGIIYADFDRQSPCQLLGDGAKYYEMRLPLKGCGTRELRPSLFVNNIVVRFHRSFEFEDDEPKTIVCNYPPPKILPPPDPPTPTPAPFRQIPDAAQLTQYEPFVFIAGILFLALVLAGLGTTTYYTRQQTLLPIHTPPPPPPLISKTIYDTYGDNISVITTEDVDTIRRIPSLPQISSQIIDNRYVTTLHEIDTVEDYSHDTRAMPNYTQASYDDCYATNQDEIVEDERFTQKLAPPSRIEVRTIEDTFITNVDEIVEKERMIFREAKNQQQNSQQDYYSGYTTSSSHDL